MLRPGYESPSAYQIAGPILNEVYSDILQKCQQKLEEKEKFLDLCNQLLTSVAATAGLERFFSNFGIIQSKLRNRLGNEKASKLVFMFKYLNQDTRKKKANLDWIWQEQLVQITEAVAISENSSDGNVSSSTIIE
ncbi:uncharacterized protein LOC143897656 [Temnothorax americanus]|uniref:uncharacterized protein LOC143897656 n=1 Tax=Temnothorax americanus TaxID=1964332 RepID=UPI00406868DB